MRHSMLPFPGSLLVLLGFLGPLASPLRAEPAVVAQLERRDEDRSTKGELHFDLGGGDVRGFAEVHERIAPDRSVKGAGGEPIAGRFELRWEFDGHYGGGAIGVLSGRLRLTGRFVPEAQEAVSLSGQGTFRGTVNAPHGVARAACTLENVNSTPPRRLFPDRVSTELVFTFAPTDQSPEAREDIKLPQAVMERLRSLQGGESAGKSDMPIVQQPAAPGPARPAPAAAPGAPSSAQPTEPAVARGEPRSGERGFGVRTLEAPEEMGTPTDVGIPGRPDSRVTFVYKDNVHKEDGTYRRTGPDAWTETCPDGVVFKFREVTRDKDFIELYDQSRQMSIRLYARNSMWRHPTYSNGQWRTLYSGTWREAPASPLPDAPAPDDPLRALQVSLAQAKVDAAEAQAVVARQKHASLESMWKKGYVSRYDLDKGKAALAAAEATLAEARWALQLALRPGVDAPKTDAARTNGARTREGEPAHSVAGTWVDTTEDWGQSTWILTPSGDGRYQAQQKGFGNARGTATISGNRLRIDWATGDGWRGVLEYELAPDGRSGRGQNVITSGGRRGTFASSIVKRAGGGNDLPRAVSRGNDKPTSGNERPARRHTTAYPPGMQAETSRFQRPAAQSVPSIAGVWVDTTEGWGQSTWTLTPSGDGRYQAQQKGFGNARGTATVSGNRLRIDWATGAWRGHLEYELAPDGMSGRGRNVITSGGRRGTFASTIQKQSHGEARRPVQRFPLAEGISSEPARPTNGGREAPESSPPNDDPISAPAAPPSNSGIH